MAGEEDCSYGQHLTFAPCQVRLSHQLEEGQQFPVHLVTAPKKARLGAGPMRIHLQNLRFSLTQGVPPALIHTWDLVDLRSVKDTNCHKAKSVQRDNCGGDCWLYRGLIKPLI